MPFAKMLLANGDVIRSSLGAARVVSVQTCSRFSSYALSLPEPVPASPASTASLVAFKEARRDNHPLPSIPACNFHRRPGYPSD